MGQFLISAFKFVCAVLLAPVVVATSVTFVDHLITYPSTYEEFLLWGAATFLLLYLFFHQFWGVYEFGQRIVGSMFKFIAPLDRFVVMLLPFYLILILVVFYVIKGFFKIETYDPYFVFFAGFALAMHIILVAQEMQNQEKSAIKSTYLLAICFVIVGVMSLCVLFLDLIVGKWTFADYFSSLLSTAGGYYGAIFQKMAVP